MTLDTSLSRHSAPALTAELDIHPGSLVGRRAIVTGGATPLGRAVADAFRANGATVVLVSAQPLPGALSGDMGDLDFVARMVESAVFSLGGIDVVALVPEYGVAANRRAAEAPIDRVLDRTARPLFHVASSLRPHLHPGMSLIASAAIDPEAQGIGDREARAALETFTKSLADRMEPAGVRVNAVAAGSRLVNDGELAESFVRLAISAPASVTGQVDVVG